MKRRLFISGAVASAFAFAVTRGGTTDSDSVALKGNFPALDKSLDDWKVLLDSQQYQVLFEEATERPWSSPLNNEKRDGVYICSACFLPLFNSEAKFDSGTGWPSFFRAIEANVGTRTDYKLLFPRTEYHCARCEGHQGHIFDDGPEPTGQRWCNNGLALQFVPSAEPLPELRV